MDKKANAIVAVFGFLTVFGAVGGMEDPANDLLPLVGIAIAGLFLMYAGINGIKNA